MAKTSIDVDEDIARQAAAIFGTKTLKATVDAALREAVLSRRRLELITLLADENRFDFDAMSTAWGADE